MRDAAEYMAAAAVLVAVGTVIAMVRRPFESAVLVAILVWIAR